MGESLNNLHRTRMRDLLALWVVVCCCVCLLEAQQPLADYNDNDLPDIRSEYRARRGSSGFVGMRGRRTPLDFNPLEEDKRAAFTGMRGKKAPFNGMRGKKSESDYELENLQNRQWWDRFLRYNKRVRSGSSGFIGMRG